MASIPVHSVVCVMADVVCGDVTRRRVCSRVIGRVANDDSVSITKKK